MQMVCALVKPTIMARKMVRASRGIDPKRPAEPRRAESRHDREAARAHTVSGRRREGSKIAGRARTPRRRRGMKRKKASWRFGGPRVRRRFRTEPFRGSNQLAYESECARARARRELPHRRPINHNPRSSEREWAVPAVGSSPLVAPLRSPPLRSGGRAGSG